VNIPGLPEGIDVVRIGIAKVEEFEIINQIDGSVRIVKGRREGTNTQVIVKPADGFAFAFDIRTLSYNIVKLLTQPREITATLKFSVMTEEDTKLVEDALDRLRQLPGYVPPV
jgi:hypothetical protein